MTSELDTYREIYNVDDLVFCQKYIEVLEKELDRLSKINPGSGWQSPESRDELVAALDEIKRLTGRLLIQDKKVEIILRGLWGIANNENGVVFDPAARLAAQGALDRAAEIK